MSKRASTYEVAQQYDGYRKKLKDDAHLAYQGKAGSMILKHLTELHDLFANVKSSSKMAVYHSDSQALSETSAYASINARNLKFGDLGVALNSEEFVHKLKLYLGRTKQEPQEETEEEYVDSNLMEEKFNGFSWLKLGLLYYKTSNKPIPMEFLNGPLESEKRVINRSRRVDDTRGLTSTTAQQVTANDLETDTQNTATIVRSVFAEIRKKQKGNSDAINFFKFFIDPTSFSQSVENLFFTSFLIRDGRLRLFKDGNGIPMITSVGIASPGDLMHEERGEKNSHHIASFDYFTWQTLIEKYNITEGYLGHRDVEGEVWDQADDDDDDDNEDDDEDADNDEDEANQSSTPRPDFHEDEDIE
ncbi:hypothetical protein PSN45_002456 [Yamadazyma tenuis]|uniref:Non-structural maintenance of chromosomes element 4 n=1 Tax=Candida tenuis (strain ATCC 10573 / BCRC 21748 / CBS 615 / JCM 9827 / NBRC 10315 / NRRL Y-1498 / VKM Y-70) TaxID=590646 RepID=G3B0E4_CANTC|nr:uncharacterized protein CANTEDRAFT_133681 [Yamadazyma tenuis ATCC 10573]EGV65380.1 hypothetical protein CANTEDRAFT_133681 [Yamadazyma tenuis ATCC 10573]WEJ94953.1 hypothetical protein PSN45_002456 [Yamadazyma tenuis]